MIKKKKLDNKKKDFYICETKNKQTILDKTLNKTKSYSDDQNKEINKEEIKKEKDTIKITTCDKVEIKKDYPNISDSLIMHLEQEVMNVINHRLEEHICKRIKGVLAPIAKLSLKMGKIKNNFSGEQAKYFLDVEDDINYILENSKFKRISPKIGENFNQNLQEEIDFSWNPDYKELEILDILQDGFIWEFNQEIVIKPKVIVNRRVS